MSADIIEQEAAECSEPAAHSSSPSNVASRTLALLSAFDETRAVLGVTELARAAAVPKSTAHRLLTVMLRHGYIKRDGNRYRLAEHVFELGSRAAGPRGLRDRAIPFMVELHHETRAVVHLAVLHDDQVLYLEKVFGHGGWPCPTAIGSRNPAHCTALGKVLLSRSPGGVVEDIVRRGLPRLTEKTVSVPGAFYRELSRAQDDGVAVEIEQCRLGLACVAAPIIDRRSQQPIAALSISTTTAHFNATRLADRVRKAAAALSI
ncbi:MULTISPECIES: IclR family transcriptional regulator [unclassified Mycobacterium]|uniref:IclR family transcriptional regulator n=1 Tax=unclassified Mycobacterium TaxID=2642494 RepID=UPI0029C799D8|nr:MULTISPECIES: IclR family transcriptional regulator [unclassified Mycobacterium]